MHNTRVITYALPEGADLPAVAGEGATQPPAEFAEFIETGEPPAVDWDASSNSANSANSAGGKTWRQGAVIPSDSLLALWKNYAQEQVEGADSYIIGSILPVCAALLARRVWFQWGDVRQYPNLFALLAGKPGDRKSSTIKLAAPASRSVSAQQLLAGSHVRRLLAAFRTFPNALPHRSSTARQP